jgi:protein ImuB
MLFDRLAGRLGAKAVVEPHLVRDAQPEHAWMGMPPAGGASRASATQTRLAAPAERRPSWLFPRPVVLDVVAVVSAATDAGRPPVRFRHGGQVHDVAAAHGPERIETAWWRGPIVRRDYYVVETQTGGRFWIFRRLKDGGWFLHGVFA